MMSAVADNRTAELLMLARPRDPLGFLAGGGEMGERTRAFDWSQTPVGPGRQMATEPQDGRPHHARFALRDVARLGPGFHVLL